MRSGKHCFNSKTALQPVMIAILRRPPFGKAFAIIAITAIVTIRIHFSGQLPVIMLSCLLVSSRFSKLQLKEEAMAEKVMIGLKKKGPAESPAKTEKRPDIELTEEDLKQIAGGTTKA